jgi:hypothetical protein
VLVGAADVELVAPWLGLGVELGEGVVIVDSPGKDDGGNKETPPSTHEHI